jgi:hypothetical protein
MPGDSAREPLEPALRFDGAAEAAPAAPACARCGREIARAYYEVSGSIVCPDCKALLEAEAVAGSATGRLSRAALFGLGGAVAGAALYYAILAITGYEIGLVAIAVGWLVGRAVQLGSRHRGGRVYQVLAVVLTYLAIVSTYLPFIFQGDFELPSASAAVALLLVTIAAPFLAGLENVIGILIIGFALWQAWHMNGRATLVFSGPYALGAPRAPEPEAP